MIYGVDNNSTIAGVKVGTAEWVEFHDSQFSVGLAHVEYIDTLWSWNLGGDGLSKAPRFFQVVSVDSRTAGCLVSTAGNHGSVDDNETPFSSDLPHGSDDYGQ